MQETKAITKFLKETSGSSYSGNIALGSKKILGNMLFDTYSGYTSVSHVECETCNRKIYDPAQSTEASSTGQKVTTEVSKSKS